MERTMSSKKRSNSIFLLLLIMLLILRFPVLISACCHITPFYEFMVSYIFQDGTYLITAILILLKRDTLFDYNIGICSLIIFILAPASEILSEYFEFRRIQTCLWFEIGVSICLFIALFLFRPKFHKRSIKEILLWFLIAVAVGICIGILSGLLQRTRGTIFPDRPTVWVITYKFLIQLGNAAIIEEPLFRGFLWGFLKKSHWNDCWIWLFQALLFWLGHIYFLGVNNYSFFIIIPMGALILGLVAWRSKSIAASMTVHGLFNSISQIVAFYTW